MKLERVRALKQSQSRFAFSLLISSDYMTISDENAHRSFMRNEIDL